MSPLAPARLLIVDDEVAQLNALCDILGQEGYVTRGFNGGREAIAALREEPYDVLLTDLMMPQIDGITLLRACHEIDRDLACIVMTGHATVATAVEALKTGALDYVMKPFNVSQILAVLTRALATRRLHLENIQLRETVSIYELARAITQGLGDADIVDRTLAAAVALTDAAGAYLLTPAPGTTATDGALRLAGAAGPAAAPLEPPAGDAKALSDWLGLVGAELEALAVQGSADALFEHPFGPAISVALPIVTAGTFFGVLGFASTRARRRISVGQLKALDVLARTAAAAFASAALVRELRAINGSLEQRVADRTRELEVANRDLESFSYSVSHDLRQPLTVVEGFCDIFRSQYAGSVPEDGQRMLEQIWSGAARMNKLISDLLHFSRMSRGPLEGVPVPMRKLAAQVIERLKVPLGHRPISVQMADLPDCFGDPALLEQVLVNLISNAFKFTAGRDPAQIEVGTLRQGSESVYYVRDNGVGFDMRYAEKLFGVFQRMHSTEEFEGTGIGLSIVHRIVTRHGGRVWADSRKGVGTTFYFTLPASPPDSGAEGAAPQGAESGACAA
jgi:signal transduction histidine kinase/FixJ family two-component response regulator